MLSESLHDFSRLMTVALYLAAYIIAGGDVLLEAGKILKVFMNSANGFALKCGDSSINYTVSKDGNELENNACVLEVAAGSTSGVSALTFATTADNIKVATIAGAHKDTVTFSCSLEDASTD